MMSRSDFPYATFLENASEGMLRLPQSDKFMHWITRSLYYHLRPSHVSIALYDPSRNSFCVRHSTGPQKFPMGLIQLDENNPLAREMYAFRGRSAVRRFSKPLVSTVLQKKNESGGIEVLRLMRLHRTQVCAKIETYGSTIGYLLIGPKDDGTDYSADDLSCFQAIANDVAIEIQKEEYYKFSHYDPLTKLLNRQCLTDCFQKMRQRADEHNRPFAVAISDLDNFKKVNDRYGHLAGDQVLRISAGIVQSSTRKSDLIFRYGGEEFLFLLEMSMRNPDGEMTNESFRENILMLLERIRRKIAERPLEYLSQEIPVSVSIGVSFWLNSDVKSQEEILSEADRALYYSKRAGKNRVTLYSPALEASSDSGLGPGRN